MEAIELVHKIQDFTATLSREEFYDFYSLMSSLTSPICGDYILVDKTLVNIKKITRRIRITLMYPRFEVDYAKAYTLTEAREEANKLIDLFPKLDSKEKDAVAKLIKVLEILSSKNVAK